MKEEIIITLNQKYIRNLITKHVVEKYGEVLGIKNAGELDWDDCSLIFGENDGLHFKKINTK